MSTVLSGKTNAQNGREFLTYDELYINNIQQAQKIGKERGNSY